MSQSLVIHQALKLAAQAYRQSEFKLATLLYDFHRKKLYRDHGYSSTTHYAETELDLQARKTRALVAIGKALPEMPHLMAAFAAGKMPYTKAREVLRVATPETDAEWTQRALDSTSRELEDAVAMCKPGDTPPPPETVFAPPWEDWTLRFDRADAEVVAGALKVMRQGGEFGEDVSDSALLASLARRFLAADDVPVKTAERHLVVVKRCPDCEATHVGRGHASDAVCGMATCDAEVLDLTRPEARKGHQVPPRTRARVFARDGYRCVVPGCGSTLWLDVHHFHAQSNGGPHAEANLVTLCDVHHVLVHHAALLLKRTPQGIRVLARDGEPFGAPSDAAPRSELAQRILDALVPGPAYAEELERRLGLPPGRLPGLLSMLKAQAEVVRIGTGEWVRLDRIIPGTPTWVARERRAAPAQEMPRAA